MWHTCTAFRGNSANLAFLAQPALLTLLALASYPVPSQAQSLPGAAQAGDTAAVRRLLEEGADPNLQDHEGHSPLHVAAAAGRPGTLGLLLEHGADPALIDAWGRTPLLLVARESGNEAAARVLLEHGAGVNALDRSGASGLELAAWRGFSEVVDVLLDYGATVDRRGERTPLLTSYAVTKGLERLFGELLRTGVDLGIRTENGGSLLHAAAEGGSVEITRLLLEQGLDAMEEDTYRWTPLHYAAERGRTAVSELLVARGADVNARTLAGHTPLSLTEIYEKEEEARLLRSRGAVRGPAPPARRGPWMGETTPGSKAKVFAQDLVSSNRFEHGTVSFSPDGREAFWESSFLPDERGYSWGRILTSRLEGGEWTRPTFAPFSPDWHYGDDVPFFSPDGEKLFFASMRPLEEGGEPAGEQIWVVERTLSGWGRPEVLRGGPNTMGMHWQFSVAANGDIYFGSGDPGGFGAGDIYVSRSVDGSYRAPENLGPSINSPGYELSPFIAPDQSYLLFTAMDRPDGFGRLDLYISFKTPEGSWTEPVNLGGAVNGPGDDLCPQVTSDGAYLFWNSQRTGNSDNYWMDAGIIEALRARTLETEAGEGGQNLGEQLGLLRRFLGGEWVGRFEEADEPMSLGMTWEVLLDGGAVRMSGWSPGMTRSNTYYWDAERGRVAYLALTSNGYVGRGTMRMEDSVLVAEGRQVWPDGSAHDTMARWEFLSGGSVRTIGYSQENQEWVPGHRILYTRKDRP